MAFSNYRTVTTALLVVQADNSKLVTEAAANCQSLAELQQHSSELEALVTELREKLTAADSKLAEMTNQNEAREASHADAAQLLESKLCEAKQQLARTLIELEALKSELEQSVEQSQRNDVQVGELEVVVTELREKLTAADSKLAEITNQNEARVAAHAEAAGSLEEQSKEQQLQLTSSERQLRSSEMRVLEMETSAAALEEEKTAITERMQMLQQQVESPSLVLLQAVSTELSVREQQLEDLQSQLLDMETALQEFAEIKQQRALQLENHRVELAAVFDQNADQLQLVSEQLSGVNAQLLLEQNTSQSLTAQFEAAQFDAAETLEVEKSKAAEELACVTEELSLSVLRVVEMEAAISALGVEQQEQLASLHSQLGVSEMVTEMCQVSCFEY